MRVMKEFRNVTATQVSLKLIRLRTDGGGELKSLESVFTENLKALPSGINISRSEVWWNLLSLQKNAKTPTNLIRKLELACALARPMTVSST
jgi:hypothetical protein